MTKEEFKRLRALVYDPRGELVYFRVGQWASLCLHCLHPEIEKSLPQGIDPFYRDDRLTAFWEYLEGLVE